MSAPYPDLRITLLLFIKFVISNSVFRNLFTDDLRRDFFYVFTFTIMCKSYAFAGKAFGVHLDVVGVTLTALNGPNKTNHEVTFTVDLWVFKKTRFIFHLE